jgi:hypothetical protein
MAQSTAGIKVYYGESTVSNNIPAIPSTWTVIPDIISTPALSATPAKLETTTLAETVQKTYIDGLQDLGGSFEFSANMTTALVAAIDLAAVDPGTGKARAFAIVFPSPLSKAYWWTGEVQAVAPGEASVDAVATTTVFISQATALAAVTAAQVS